jgi:hypothetical protein
MGRFSGLVLGLVLIVAAASPSAAKVVAIETSARVQDHAEESVRAALAEAVEAAVAGAVAMGLPWVRMSYALLVGDAVTVGILATDADPHTETGEDGWGQDTEPRNRTDHSPRRANHSPRRDVSL